MEKIIVQQLTPFLDKVASPHLSGIRKNHSCQDVLLNFVEKCKEAIDLRKVYGIVMTDLSKALDCLPPTRLSGCACKLLANYYFTNRFQCVKVVGEKSDRLLLSKGAPQGSILGPFIFNFFQTDLLYRVQDMADIFNYADDNTVSVSADSINSMLYALHDVLDVMLTWFRDNHMQANPDTFKMMVFNQGENVTHSIMGNDTIMLSVHDARVLGLLFDAGLSFKNHISLLCQKADKHVMSRLSKHLGTEAKLLLFKTFGLSHFNFCPLVWHHCNQDDIIKMEKVQFRALRFVYSDFNES